jgi:hypothetical protein
LVPTNCKITEKRRRVALRGRRHGPEAAGNRLPVEQGQSALERILGFADDARFERPAQCIIRSGS